MAATFPGGVKNFTTKQTEDDIMASHVNDLQDEVVAIESELLTPSKFPVTPESAPTSDYQVANKKYVDDMPGRYIPITPVMVNATTSIPIGTYEVDAVGDWGIPASAKAVVLRASPRFATIDNSNYLAIRPTPTAPVGDENVMVIRGQAPNIYTELIGFCGLTGGKFYYEVAGEAMGSWSSILIIGYFT